MGSILSEIKGSMTGFERLTPEMVEKLSCDGLTYDELKEAMQKSGLSIDKVVCDPTRVLQNAFFADYENGKYCEIYLQKSYIDQLMQVSTVNFSYSGKNPILISQDWQRFYQQSVPLPMAIYDFSRRYLDIPKNKVFSVWFFIHKRLDYSYGLWDSELLEYVYTYASEFEPPQTDNDGYVTVYRGIGNNSLPTEKAISLTINIISLLIWCEIPIAVIILSVVNGFIICKNYDGSIFFKINIALSLMCIGLAGLNWNLYIGLRLLEWYNGQ